MNEPAQEFTARQWVETWKKAGPELERIRNEELRNMDENEGTRIATLLGVAEQLLRRRESGIGELHNLLLRAINRNND